MLGAWAVILNQLNTRWNNYCTILALILQLSHQIYWYLLQLIWEPDSKFCFFPSCRIPEVAFSKPMFSTGWTVGIATSQFEVTWADVMLVPLLINVVNYMHSYISRSFFNNGLTHIYSTTVFVALCRNIFLIFRYISWSYYFRMKINKLLKIIEHLIYCYVCFTRYSVSWHLLIYCIIVYYIFIYCVVS